MTKLIFDTTQEFENLMCSLSGNGDCDTCGGCIETKRCLKAEPVDWAQNQQGEVVLCKT